jgi:hypothetical protein
MLRKRALLTENVLTPQIQSFPFIGARYLPWAHSSNGNSLCKPQEKFPSS